MIRRILIFSLLVIFCIVPFAYADSVRTSSIKARVASVSGAGVEIVTAVADGATGDVADVDSRGSLSVREYPSQIITVNSATLNSGTCPISGELYAKNVIFSNAESTTGVIYALVYSGTGATGNALEIRAGTATTGSTTFVPLDSAKYSAGIFVDANTDYGTLTIIYDN